MFAVSDGEGVLAIHMVTTEPAVVWITMPGRTAQCIHNLAGGQLDLPTEVVLQPAGTIRALVTDETGNPVSHAVVRQCFSLWNKPPGKASHSAIAQRLFQRTYATDTLGYADIASLNDYHLLMGSLGSAVTHSWIGSEPSEARLILRESFSASGTVPKHQDMESRLAPDRILVSAVVNNTPEDIGGALVRDDGTWGPVRLACRPASEYRYLLESTVWMPHVISREAPNPGETVRVDFPGEPGLILPVHVVDLEKQPLEGVRVNVEAEFNHGRIGSYAFTDKEGMATIRNLRRGGFWVSTMKPGYAPWRSIRYEMYRDSTFAFEVELGPSGCLKGVCRSQGLPVSSFSIIYWQDGMEEPGERRFVDRTNGEFLISDVPLGALSIVAVSASKAWSRITTVDMQPNSTTHADLELPGFTLGSGKIVAASTGEPIPDATIQPQVLVPGRNLGAIGPACTSAADGTFAIEGFAPGTNLIHVSAPGFASRKERRTTDQSGILDYGWIALHRGGRVDVQVLGDTPADFSGSEVQLHGEFEPDPVKVDADGKATFDAVPPNTYTVQTVMNRSHWIDSMLLVRPGSSNSLTVDARRVRQLSAKVVAAAGGVVPPGMVCRASFRAADGVGVIHHVVFNEQSIADLACVAADDMILEAYDEWGTILASKVVHSARDKVEVIELTVGGEPITIQLVTSDHTPIPGAGIQFLSTTPGSAWRLGMRADEKGEAVLHSVPDSPLIALLRSPQGHRWIQPFELPAKRDKPFEIVLAGNCSVELRARDGAVALPGVSLELGVPQADDFVFERIATDDAGRARFQRLEHQDFEVRVLGVGLWPTVVHVSPTLEGAQRELQVRRLGGARLRATIVGTPFRNKPIQVRSVEFDTDVAEWLAAGRIEASANKLITDADGRLNLDGLPNGQYTWSAKSSDGTQMNGHFTVPPRAVTDVTISLP
ncbi:MAG: carboxypeptidase regulatory-like domain-containing protein [Planctomycetes bacterium]|nr:carboxypeptidase regulatory-like domain-containing protein [Planctomycetota bacterium]